MTRSWIRRAMIAGAMIVVGGAALVGTVALAFDDTTILVGAGEARQHNRRGVNLVAKSVNSPYVPGPAPAPDDPPRKDPPQEGLSIGNPTTPGLENDGGGLAIGGVSLSGSMSPEARLEGSLKDLARELR